MIHCIYKCNKAYFYINEIPVSHTGFDSISFFVLVYLITKTHSFPCFNIHIIKPTPIKLTSPRLTYLQMKISLFVSLIFKGQRNDSSKQAAFPRDLERQK